MLDGYVERAGDAFLDENLESFMLDNLIVFFRGISEGRLHGVAQSIEAHFGVGVEAARRLIGAFEDVGCRLGYLESHFPIVTVGRGVRGE